MKDGQLKIADFGFSIGAKEASKPSKYNVGSPLYMAPESLRKNEYSFKSDIWALGVIFYEMLFGQPPWRAKNEKELLKKIETESIQSLLLPTTTINPISREFILKCLAFDRNDRMGPEELEKFSFRSQQQPQITLPELTPNRPFKEKVLIERVNQTTFCTPTEPIMMETEKKAEVKDFTKSVERKDRQNLENRLKKP